MRDLENVIKLFLAIPLVIIEIIVDAEARKFAIICLGIFLAYIYWDFVLDILIIILILAGAAIVLFLIFRILESIFFNSKKFKMLKEELAENTKKCNELNEHLAELKTQFADFHSRDFGTSCYTDKSIFHFKRPLLQLLTNKTEHEYACSLNVCKNAHDQPIVYFCKYFNVPINESSLEIFESMLNDFTAAEEGKTILLQQRKDILEKYKHSKPFFVSKESFLQSLGYQDVDISNAHIQKYSFVYVSGGGNSSMRCDITLDCENLEKLITYIGSKIELSKSIRYQRSLITTGLREKIKSRDNYTCQICGLSIKDEPHLLLEIDHIIPLSKGGTTTIHNLQTLCWRCNRQKGAKLFTINDCDNKLVSPPAKCDV